MQELGTDRNLISDISDDNLNNISDCFNVIHLHIILLSYTYSYDCSLTIIVLFQTADELIIWR